MASYDAERQLPHTLVILSFVAVQERIDREHAQRKQNEQRERQRKQRAAEERRRREQAQREAEEERLARTTAR